MYQSRWPQSKVNFPRGAAAGVDQLRCTAERLFGVHPQHGFLRVEYAGALMVNDSRVVGVEPDRIVFDRFSDCRKKPGQTWRPPVWEYAARAR
ncbi:MAG: hypothetical protein K2X54_16155 [Methylobacterium organophilum]|nr:hypothetical protein [Methylobacterium organophilum]